jgi:hypothetical protein
MATMVGIFSVGISVGTETSPAELQLARVKIAKAGERRSMTLYADISVEGILFTFAQGLLVTHLCIV